MQQRGVYFLANDRVFTLVVAFLNSFRVHNPDLPLCLIPYNDDTDRIRNLSTAYNFTVLDDAEELQHCDAISRCFHKNTIGHYRKIAAWSGIFREFIYIDIDTVVLRPMDFVFSLLEEYDVITAYSDDPSSRMFVWKDSLIPTTQLTADEISFATNTGFIVSRRGLFFREQVDHFVELAKPLAPHMDLDCFEQPLLNFLIVKSTHRRTSIFKLNRDLPEKKLACECWAGDKGWEIKTNGTCTYRGAARDGLFMHWSGMMAPRLSERRVYSLLKKFGIKPPLIRIKMPFRYLWRHYRYLRRV